MTTLRFRNINASPDDPVETWPFEGVLAALERGTLPDWQRLAAAIVDEPWGHVARQTAEALALDLPYGVPRWSMFALNAPRPSARKSLVRFVDCWWTRTFLERTSRRGSAPRCRGSRRICRGQ
jgi:hypothetical protein